MASGGGGGGAGAGGPPAAGPPAVGGAGAGAAPAGGGFMFSRVRQLARMLGTATGAAMITVFRGLSGWLWDSPITPPTSLEEINKLATSENLFYNPPAWLSSLREKVEEDEPITRTLGLSREALLARITTATTASKQAHLAGFDLLRIFLIYLKIYSKEGRRTITDPRYRIIRRTLNKAIIKYLLSRATKENLYAPLLLLATRSGVDAANFGYNSSFSVGNGIKLDSMPPQLAERLNEFITMLSPEERAASLLEPGGGHQANAMPPVIRGLGDIDDALTKEADGAFNAILDAARRRIRDIEAAEDAEIGASPGAHNVGRQDFTDALEELANTILNEAGTGGAGAAAAPSGGGLLALPSPGVAGEGAGGAAMAALLAAAPVEEAGGRRRGAGALSAALSAAAGSSSSSSGSAAAAAPLPAGFLAAGAPPPPPPPPGGGGADVTAMSGAQKRKRTNGENAGGAGAGAGASAGAGNNANAAAAAKRSRTGPGNNNSEGSNNGSSSNDEELPSAGAGGKPSGEQGGGARRTRRRRSARKSHRRPMKRSSSRKGHKSTRKQSKKHRGTRSRKH